MYARVYVCACVCVCACASVCLAWATEFRRCWCVRVSNPYFKDVKALTVEPYICHAFDAPFYGEHLRLVVVAYLRSELDFTGLGPSPCDASL